MTTFTQHNQDDSASTSGVFFPSICPVHLQKYETWCVQVYACSMECARPGNGRELILISREVRRARQDVLIHGSSSPVTCMSCDAISSNEPMVLSSQTKPGYILFRAPKWTRAALSQPACLGCTVSLLLFLRYTHWLLCIKSDLGQRPGKDSNCTSDHV